MNGHDSAIELKEPEYTTARTLSLTNDEAALLDLTSSKQETSPTTPDDENSSGQQFSLWGLVPVTTALCATLFCTSLVSGCILHSNIKIFFVYWDSGLGRNHSCNSYTQDHNSVELSGWCCMVWQRISICYMCCAIDIWEALHLLFIQMGIFNCSPHLRNRLGGLWYCTNIYSPYCWACCSRLRVCRSLFRSPDYCEYASPAAYSSNLYRSRV